VWRSTNWLTDSTRWPDPRTGSTSSTRGGREPTLRTAYSERWGIVVFVFNRDWCEVGAAPRQLAPVPSAGAWAAAATSMHQSSCGADEPVQFPCCLLKSCGDARQIAASARGCGRLRPPAHADAADRRAHARRTQRRVPGGMTPAGGDDAHNRGETMARRTEQDAESHITGRGSKPDAPRARTGEVSGTRSTGAKKSSNRPGPSGTGSKKQTRGSSSRRRSGSRSGGGQGSKGKS
jgi:hypothetical protein